MYWAPMASLRGIGRVDDQTDVSGLKGCSGLLWPSRQSEGATELSAEQDKRGDGSKREEQQKPSKEDGPLGGQRPQSFQ